ncbi:MAG: hypothetical protein WB791_09550 [Waddliaceae bacterium]
MPYPSDSGSLLVSILKDGTSSSLGVSFLIIGLLSSLNPHSACCAGDFFIFLILSGLQNLDW